MKMACSAKSYLDGLTEEFELPMPAKGDSFSIGSKGDVYDDLIISATLIEDGGQQVFLVTLEVSFIRPLLVEHIYESIRQVAPELKKENLFVNATHTHTGPVYSRDQQASNHKPGAEESDDRLFLELVEHWGRLAAGLYTECRANLTECYGEIASVALEGCFSSREGLDAPCDKYGTVIRFSECGTGRRIGMWLNLACHSLFHPEFGLLGSDLIGGTAKKLQELYGVYAQPLAGCQGNTSTKHTGRRTTGIQDAIEEKDRVAEEIVRQLRQGAVFEKLDMAECRVQHLTLQYDCCGSSGTLAVGILSFGTWKLALFNGELVNTLGPELTCHESGRHRLVVCYVNGQTEYPLDESGQDGKAPVPLAKAMIGMAAEALAREEA